MNNYLVIDGSSGIGKVIVKAYLRIKGISFTQHIITML